jgi:hypothetical protein
LLHTMPRQLDGLAGQNLLDLCTLTDQR